MSDGVTTDEQLLSQARKLRREAHDLERIGHALSLAAGRRRFLDDARDLHARADRLEAQVRSTQVRSIPAADAARGADADSGEDTPAKAKTPGSGEA